MCLFQEIYLVLYICLIEEMIDYLQACRPPSEVSARSAQQIQRAPQPGIIGNTILNSVHMSNSLFSVLFNTS